MSTSTETIEQLASREYKYGFETERRDGHVSARPRRAGRPPAVGDQGRARVAARVPAEVVSRLARDDASRRGTTSRLQPIDYQAISYYSAPKKKPQLASMDEVDPEVRKTFEKLGIPLDEQKLLAGVAVDAVFDSVSVATTFRAKLGELGIIFCSFSEAVKDHPELVQEVPRLGRAVHRQLLRDAELGGVQRRLVRLRAEGRALPDGAVDVLPHQREEHRTVRADADRRRRGLVRELPRRLHGADARRDTSCTRRSSSSSRSTTRRSSTRRFRTGTPATRTARAASTTSSPSAARR